MSWEKEWKRSSRSSSLSGYEGLAAATIAQAMHDIEACDTHSHHYRTAVRFLTDPASLGATPLELMGWDLGWVRNVVERLVDARRRHGGKRVSVESVVNEKEVSVYAD